MAPKPKKAAKPAETVESTDETVEATAETTNVVKTDIIEDTPVANKSKRRNAGSVKKGEIVTIQNSTNGATNKMAAEFALKLVNKPNSTYSILNDGEK